MVLPVNGDPLSGWPAIMLGASILLLGGGIHAVVPRIRRAWFVLFAGGIPVVLCAVLFRALPLRCWFLAFAVALCMGIIQALARALKRAEYVVLITSLILAASWVPVTVHTLHAYFSPTTGRPAPTALVFLLGMWVLIVESVVAGALLCKSPKSGDA
jgi:hypothetical protein